MTGALRWQRCAVCGRHRPRERWALGLDAVLEGERVAWLCDDCEATPGRAWLFVDIVRDLYPAAELVTTTAYAHAIVQAPLVLAMPPTA